MRIARILLVTLLLGGLVGLRGASAGQLFDEPTLEFAREVDSPALAVMAVQYMGRTAILDTAARGELGSIYGQVSIDGTSPVFGYLELSFNAGKYIDRPVLYIKSPKMRKLLGQALGDSDHLGPIGLLNDASYKHLISAERATPADFERTGALGSLEGKLSEIAATQGSRLFLERLQSRAGRFVVLSPTVIPIRSEGWVSPDIYLGMEKYYPETYSDWVGQPVASFAKKWLALGKAWQERDAKAVNRLIVDIDGMAREIPGLSNRSVFGKRLELAYNRINRDKISLIGFAISLILAVAAMATGKKWAFAPAVTVLFAVTLWMFAGFVVRWIISGRPWYLPPMMNQYEAVIGSAMLAGIVAVALELIYRRGVFGLAASLYAVIALIAALLLGEKMDPSISVSHGILNSPVMAAHVAVIIIGHAMVGMAGVISLIYLGWAGFTGRSESPRLAGIDRANLIVAQIAVWTMVAGTALGAYWADIAWGRWWGWDNKETWALITCLIFLAMLHLRMVTRPRWRGPVTAICCLVGCGAMLFNWIVVNYLMSGLHSYS